MNNIKRRTVKGLLVRPQNQIKFAFVFVGGALFSISVMVAVLLATLANGIALLVQANRLDQQGADFLHSSIRMGLYGVVGFGFIFAVYSLWIGIRISHRVYGPMVPMQRVVESLTAGDYSARVQLRADDEFTDFAAHLNALAAKLESSKK